MLRCLAFLIAAGCGAAIAKPAARPLTLTYLGVAGWQLDAGGHTILADPYFSRPADRDVPLVPDVAAIAAHAPPHAALVMVGHSHFDHLLDAPAVALRTGAKLLGSASTIRVGRAAGVPEDRLIAVKGGEDLELDGFSVRVIPSLHSEIGASNLLGEIVDHPALPMPASGYAEGGTLAYLIRIGRREILVFDTANFIERELVGLRPEIVIVAPGLRARIHDYTCRLLHTLGDPPVVIATHFDDFTGPPVDADPDSDLAAFAAEVSRCSPRSKLIIPRHFAPMQF